MKNSTQIKQTRIRSGSLAVGRGRAGGVLWTVLALGLRLTGVTRLARSRTRDRVGILLYHDPTPEALDRHLEFLSGRYQLIPYSRLIEALLRRDFSDLPPHSLVVHIDDGYARNRELLEVLQRHEVRPTLFLCSHIAATHRHFWSKLKGGRSKRLRLVANARLLEKLRKEADFRPEREYADRRALDRSEIEAMAGQVDFESHGRFHFSLVTLDDRSLAVELEESRRRVEGLTGRPCRHFSFPYGDYGPREVEAVRKRGYVSARTTEPGWVTTDTDPHRLPIVADVPDEASVLELEAHLTGVPRFLKRFTYRAVTRHVHSVRQWVGMRRRFF